MKKYQQYIDAWREVFQLNQDDSDCDILIILNTGLLEIEEEVSLKNIF